MHHARSLCLAIAVVAHAENAAAQAWVNLTPGAGSAPVSRRNASAIIDTAEHRMVVFGGFSGVYLNDVWAFDLDTGTWANLTPVSGAAPAPRLTPASIYDPTTHRMITWSGQGPGVFFNDVWAFDLATNTWSPFTPTGGPPQIRYGVGYTWDPLAKDLVTFAGFTNLGRFDDVWRFHATPATWTNVSPGSGPLARCLHAACYDARNHRMIMYAGQNNAGPLDDIWALDLDTNTWSDLTPAEKPSARYFSPVVYDGANHRVTMFGGRGLLGQNNEAWAFDLWTEEWTHLAPSGTPPTPREGSAAIYDGVNDRMVIFGGIDSAVRNEVWALADLSGTYTPVGGWPPTLALQPNYPNPFNPTTTIEYAVPARGRVQLRVFDVSGAMVRTLVDEVQPAGTRRVTWDGRDDRGARVASGVYLLRADAAGESRQRKMILLK
ncbi:MAG TPA: kelch repeat-containing protein [Candidatus Krumholzibacteria bacterium]